MHLFTGWIILDDRTYPWGPYVDSNFVRQNICAEAYIRRGVTPQTFSSWSEEKRKKNTAREKSVHVSSPVFWTFWTRKFGIFLSLRNERACTQKNKLYIINLNITTHGVGSLKFKGQGLRLRPPTWRITRGFFNRIHIIFSNFFIKNYLYL